MIDHLVKVNDKLIKHIRGSDLELLKTSNLYHSPEVSETDEDDRDAHRKIAVKRLKWRSDTVFNLYFYYFLSCLYFELNLFFFQKLSGLLRDYIDKISAEQSKIQKV